MPNSTTAPTRTPPTHSWPRAAVWIALILVVGLPLAYVLIAWNRTALDMPNRVLNAFSDAVRPKISINQLIMSSIGDAKNVSKLVVLKTDINADVTRDESSSSWGIYWGTNTARVIARNAHVQYVIDLENLGTSNYLYDESSKTLTLYIPAPRVDTDVSIDPAKIETPDLRGGWARWDKSDTRDNAIKELVPTVIIQAQSPLLKDKARTAGIEAITNWAKPLADSLAQDGVTLKVKYQDEAATRP